MSFLVGRYSDGALEPLGTFKDCGLAVEIALSLNHITFGDEIFNEKMETFDGTDFSMFEDDYGYNVVEVTDYEDYNEFMGEWAEYVKALSLPF